MVLRQSMSPIFDRLASTLNESEFRRLDRMLQRFLETLESDNGGRRK